LLKLESNLSIDVHLSFEKNLKEIQWSYEDVNWPKVKLEHARKIKLWEKRPRFVSVTKIIATIQEI